ncbi:MAG TPA: LytTR family DNA-binding domain-containing protein [Opitutaceae bacterium]|nr:LytTR family DNA-binding domain-containing protein [Opitutaceae bacterium]
MPSESPRRRVVLADDEPLPRRRLRRLLQAAPNVEIVEECADGAAALAAIRQHEPDIVFLDVQMPGMNGFDVLRALDPERLPVVIFVTAFDEFALAAFEAQAVDYLLKPFGEDRVRQALDRAQVFLRGAAAQKKLRDQFARLVNATTAPVSNPLLFVKREDRVLVLQPREVDWIEAFGDYVKVHVGAESHLMRSTISEMERRLRPEGFARVHRSRLVNVNHIKELRALSRGVSIVLLKNGTQLEASFPLLKAMQEQLDIPS